MSGVTVGWRSLLQTKAYLKWDKRKWERKDKPNGIKIEKEVENEMVSNMATYKYVFVWAFLTTSRNVIH